MRSRFLVGAAVAASALVFGAGAASAHTHVASTTPANGAKVKALPPTVSVTFEGQLGRAGLARITRNGRGNFAGRARLDPRNRSRLLIAVKRPGKAAARRGVWRVVWRATSVDGHRQQGMFTFRVR